MTEGRITRIPALDGYPLAATVFEGGGEWVVLSSATGVKRRFYEKFADYLRSRGFSSLVYDYRGIGDSAPERLKGFRARMRDWGQRDFNGVLDWVESRNPTRILCVGHSVGGQILGMARRAGRIDAFLAVAAQSGYWAHWDPPLRWILLGLWRAVFPLATRLFGYMPASKLGMGEDLPPQVALEWAEWCDHPNYYRDVLDDTPGFESYRGPILAYSFSDDPFGTRASVQAFLDWFPHCPAEHRHLRPEEVGLKRLGHFEFFRESSCQLFWEPAANWLAKP